MKKSKKKRRLVLVLIAIILLIIIIILLNNINKKVNPLEKANSKLEYILEAESFGDNGERYPDGAPALKRAYYGDLTIQSIGKSMYYVGTEFLVYEHELLKDKTEEQINNYYNKNSKLIKVALGIENQEKFAMLISELKSLNIDSLKFESFHIDKDTIQTANTYTTAILYIKYEECEEIALKMKINNKKQEGMSSITYTLVKE